MDRKNVCLYKAKAAPNSRQSKRYENYRKDRKKKTGELEVTHHFRINTYAKWKTFFIFYFSISQFFCKEIRRSIFQLDFNLKNLHIHKIDLLDRNP